MTNKSARYDFGRCNVEYVTECYGGIVLRIGQAMFGSGDEALFTLMPHEARELAALISQLLGGANSGEDRPTD
jgi:hypothetical protein